MGLVVKKNRGREYLYAVANRDHYFICRKDGVGGVRLDNLREAAKKIDGDFDRKLGEYLDNLQELAGLMPEDEGIEYVTARMEKLQAALDGTGASRRG